MYARYRITESSIQELANNYNRSENENFITTGRREKTKFLNQRNHLNDIYSKLPLQREGALDMEKISEEWFPLPSNPPHIFISHAHKDEVDNNFIFFIVGYLKEKFDITCFIDSWQWSYAPELLKILDNEYCRNDHNHYYSYQARNISTSLVNITLSTALQNVMDQAECSFFIQTPNSTIPSPYASTATSSVWIYMEHMAMHLLRTKKPIRTQISNETITASQRKTIPSFPEVRFPLHMKDIRQLTDFDIINWENDFHRLPKEDHISHPEQAMDLLYRLYPEGIPQDLRNSSVSNGLNRGRRLYRRKP